jgi:hypothetical protein
LEKNIGWAAFGANFAQTHLVTLSVTFLQLIYPNTTLALLAKTELNGTNKLVCHCALASAISRDMIGPGTKNF